MIDWSRCDDVESVPGRCSGAWVVKGTRVMVECILDNAEDCTPEEIAHDLYDLDLDAVRRILAFAKPGDHPEMIYMGPICDRCKDYIDEGLWWHEEKGAVCEEKDCPNTPVVYIRADLFDAKFNAKADEMMENARMYDAERELFISRLVNLLIRAREATDDHKLFSDIGEALPNLRPPSQ